MKLSSVRGIPYVRATAGETPDRAKKNIVQLLEDFGCEDIEFYEKHGADDWYLNLRFLFAGYSIFLPASASGWARFVCDENPQVDYDEALEQGKIAVYSVLRDWVKSQMTAVRSGMTTFERVFLPYMLRDGQETVGDFLLGRPNNVLPKLLQAGSDG